MSVKAANTYADREIDEKFKNVENLIREKHDDTMIKIGEVIVQTTRTNGRVRWAEKMIWLALGGLAVITFVGPSLIVNYVNDKCCTITK